MNFDGINEEDSVFMRITGKSLSYFILVVCYGGRRSLLCGVVYVAPSPHMQHISVKEHDLITTIEREDKGKSGRKEGKRRRHGSWDRHNDRKQDD